MWIETPEGKLVNLDKCDSVVITTDDKFGSFDATVTAFSPFVYEGEISRFFLFSGTLEECYRELKALAQAIADRTSIHYISQNGSLAKG
jgi:hypothetical protein